MNAKNVPDRLVLREGKLQLRDGGNVQAYVKEWQIKRGLKSDDPVVLIARDDLLSLPGGREVRRNWAA